MVSIKKYFLKDLHLKELFKGSSIAFVFKLISVLLGYVFFYALARKFGAVGLGIFNTCFTVLILSSVLAKIGLDTALVKYIAEFMATGKAHYIGKLYLTSFILIFITGAITGIIIYTFSEQLSNLFFDGSGYSNLFKIVGFTIIPFSITQLNSEYYRGLKKISAYSGLQNGTIYLIILIFIVFISKQQQQIENVIYYLLFTSIILMVLSTYFIFKQNLNLQAETKGNGFGLSKRKLISVSIPMLFSNSLFLIMNWTDTLMLSGFHGEDAVGIYNISLKIASLNTIALIAINSIASPKFSEIYASEGSRRFRRIVQQTTLLTCLISLPVFVVILVFPEGVLGIFGEEFVVGKTALVLLSIGQIVSALSGSTMIVLNMTGREKVGRNILSIAVILNILMNYLLIPEYGILGAAIATMSSSILWNVISVIYIYKSFGFLTFPFNRKSL